MANLTHETLKLIVKKLDQILKILKLGRRSNDREEKKEKKEDKSVSQDRFNQAMHNVIDWVNKKKE
jgi:hypothetical protein